MTSQPLSSVSQTNKKEENPVQEILISDDFQEKEKEKEDNNRHLYIVIEQEEGKILPVSFEMLGEARRLMDDFNSRYKPEEEKVVAIILGHNIRHLCQELIYYGADAVICADHPELKYSRNLLYTKIICQIATDKKCGSQILSSSNPPLLTDRGTCFFQQMIQEDICLLQ